DNNLLTAFCLPAEDCSDLPTLVPQTSRPSTTGTFLHRFRAAHVPVFLNALPCKALPVQSSTTQPRTRVRHIDRTAIASASEPSPPSMTSTSAHTSTESDFGLLWSDAIQTFNAQLGADDTIGGLTSQLLKCRSAEDVVAVMEQTLNTFNEFRTGDAHWKMLRNKLKPVIEVVIRLNDAVAEAAAYFPAVPGGKAIFVAFGVLLQATKGVSERFDALKDLFDELLSFLDARLVGNITLGRATAKTTVSILAHLLHVFTLAMKLMKPKKMKRFGHFMQSMIGNRDMQTALQRLRQLTALDQYAMTVDMHAMTSDTHTITSATHDAAKNTLGMLIANASKIALAQEHDATMAIFRRLNPVDSADIDSQSPEGCMEGTRVSVLDDLYTWSRDEKAPRVFWLAGMAGTGKSAITRTFCRSLERDGLLGGSFFCSRNGSAEQGDARRILPTLSVSLSSRDKVYRRRLLDALETSTVSASSNLCIQVDRLLKEPLTRPRDDNPPSLVLVIDALDECAEQELVRELLLRLIRLSASVHVKFFLTSRPEPKIRQQLGTAYHRHLHRILRLHEIERSLVQADILLYTKSRLLRMREELEYEVEFPPNWPFERDVITLARQADNLFIYAFTVLEYIQESPVARLWNFTAGYALTGRMTQTLDGIYNLVLREAMDTRKRERDEIDLTLHTMAAILTSCEPLSLKSLGSLLGVLQGNVKGSLSQLQAVISVPTEEDAGPVSIFHASFADFLTTPGRAPKDISDNIVLRGNRALASGCIAVMRSDLLHFGVSQAQTSYIPNKSQTMADIDTALQYACLNWAYHISNVDDPRALLLELQDVLSSKLL
ncbi:hypothetical protein PENSPDRAFT_15420, partial [Peniophora sp. CONT]